jgi:hypothetical protein
MKKLFMKVMKMKLLFSLTGSALSRHQTDRILNDNRYQNGSDGQIYMKKKKIILWN